MSPDPDRTRTPLAARGFATTRWTMVFRARRNNSAGRRALNEVCTLYREPLYAYIAHRGYAHADAEDLVQSFFARLLDRQLLHRADPDRGQLRNFLLKSLKDFLADEYRRAHADKRGGQAEIVALDSPAAAEQPAAATVERESPDHVFERRWALLLLERSLATLREKWERRGKAELFTALQPYLVARLEAPAAQAIAARMGLTENNVSVSLTRLREQSKVALRREVAQTVSCAADLEEELAALRKALE
jgi:RNA polymerase sigma-70 factor (ECF subfamily)